jgi:hypothetical protein
VERASPHLRRQLRCCRCPGRRSNAIRRLGVQQAGARSAPDTSGQFPARGLLPRVPCTAAEPTGGTLKPRMAPRHAKSLGVGRWAGRMAELRRPQADREAPQPQARYDPLVHPIAITEHSVIGDQIRLPAACCDMTGCFRSFADPAALGEADNRARALAVGWGADAYGRPICPGCQQRHRIRPAQRALKRIPDTVPGHTTGRWSVDRERA